MVCRENPARSAIMGLTKDIAREQGLGYMADHAYQSSIHELAHEYDGAPNLSTTEQIRLVEGVKAKVIADPTISESRKYRPHTGARSQTGIVTRLDGEIARLRAVEKDPTKEKAEQHNSGSQIMAIQRLGSMLDRQLPAQREYCTMYARHTGVTLTAAETRFRRAAESKDAANRHVRVHDSAYNDQLQVAGMTAQARADLGQSGRIRYAVATMEEERKQALASRPSRNTIGDEHKTRYLAPGEDGAQMQCVGEGACGRFGHTVDRCPNTHRVREKEHRETELRKWRDLDRAGKLAAYANSSEDRPWIESNGEVLTGGAAKSLLNSRAQKLAGDRPIPKTERDQRTVANRANAAAQRIATLEGEMDDAAPLHVSSAVREFAYNPQSGLLLVTTHPYTLKNGTERPAKTYPYRMTPEQHRQLITSNSPGSVLNETVWRSKCNGGNDPHRFDSPAEVEAAATQVKCATCGQFASPTSTHRCPVPGADEDPWAKNESIDKRERAIQRRQRRAAVNSDTYDYPDEPMAMKPVIAGSRAVTTSNGSQIVCPTAQGVIDTADAGHCAVVPVQYRSAEASVAGTLAVWNDPDGTRLSSPHPGATGRDDRGLRCTCDDYARNGRCTHIDGTMTALNRSYASVTVPNSQLTPRVTLAQHRTGEAVDTVNRASFNRLPYDAVMRIRRESESGMVSEYQRLRASGADLSAPRTVAPRDAVTRQETNVPATWQREDADDDAPTANLRDVADVQNRLRKALYSRTRDSWSVTRDNAGGIHIGVARKDKLKDGSIPEDKRRELAGVLGVRNIPGTGYYIPGETSHRYAALDRVSGDKPRIIPAAHVLSDHRERVRDDDF